MSIAVFGDVHGGEVGDAKKLNSKEVWKLCNNSFPDFAIICGDFGYIFAPESNPIAVKKEQHALRWLELKPFTVCFLRGNHDNPDRLNKLPTVEMFGADVGKVNENVYHLRDGRVYTIDNKKFFVMGGASSIDRAYRTEGINWWSNEVPSYQDTILADTNLKAHNYKVDYILTHTCPTYVKEQIHSVKFDFYDPTEKILDFIDERVVYSKWFFGHHHLDIEREYSGKTYRCLYKHGFLLQ